MSLALSLLHASRFHIAIGKIPGYSDYIADDDSSQSRNDLLGFTIVVLSLPLYSHEYRYTDYTVHYWNEVKSQDVYYFGRSYEKCSILIAKEAKSERDNDRMNKTWQKDL